MYDLEIQENKKQEIFVFLQDLRNLRYNWKLNFKKEHHSDDLENKYKQRKAWFTAISSYILAGINLGYLTKKIKKNYESFQNYMISNKINKGNRNIRLIDIETGNKLLNFAIKDLESRLNTI